MQHQERLPGFTRLLTTVCEAKFTNCVWWMQWDLGLTLPHLTIQMKTRVIITRKHIQIAQPLLRRMWWDTFYCLWNKYSFLPCTKNWLFSRALACFSVQPRQSNFPFFGRRHSTTILAEASRGHKIQTEENDQTNVASLFVSPIFWEHSLENGLASQAPFLLLAALDYLSPVWFGIRRQLFYFSL